jgi:hypothetical protein
MGDWTTSKMYTTWQLICLDEHHYVNPLDIVAIVPNGTLPKDKYCKIVTKHHNIEINMSIEEVITGIDEWEEWKKNEQPK